MLSKKRYKHNLSHFNITSMDIGKLYPISFIDVLPGDTVQGSTKALIRLSALARPIMHPIEVRIAHYFVPYTLVWDGWADFITGESATPPPTISGQAHDSSTLTARLGIYDDVQNDYSALAVRIFNSIANHYYRDQDLVTELAEDQLTIPSICWEKDRFTTARPWTQKGTAVTIPIGDSAPVISNSSDPVPSIDYPYASPSSTDINLEATGSGATPASYLRAGTGAGATGGEFKWNNTGMVADLSAASAISAIDFRTAFAMQSWQEARARYGSEYVDYLAHLGVRPRDGRLRRPEYLAGGRSYINVSEVLNTGDGTGDIGDLYGHGMSGIRSNTYRRFIEEHGAIMSVMSMRPMAVYGKGLPYKFTKNKMEDYYQKELELIGAQTVFNRELYSAHSSPDSAFGYTDRYAEYRMEENIVTGQMLDAALQDWHMARLFGSDPALNQAFVQVDEATVNRPFADAGTYDNCRVMVENQIVARRRVSANPKPALV